MERQLPHSESVFVKKSFKIQLLCDSVSGPANVGAIFRAADAFGIEKVLFTKSTPDLTSARLRKTSRNTFFTMPFEVVEDAVEILRNLKMSGYTIVGLEITEHSRKLQDFQQTNPSGFILIIGAENYGISEDILSCCDLVLHIPMYGENSSMNLAQATSVALYHLTNLLL